jgi:hypothetical protein
MADAGIAPEFRVNSLVALPDEVFREPRMEYVGTVALKFLGLAGIRTVGATTWILIVLAIIVTAGLLGRLLDRWARKRSGDRLGGQRPK